MTTKTRKTTSPPEPPPTFGDIARKKIRQRLTEYRALVERAVAGEQLTEEDMVNAYDILTSVGLAPYAFERDVLGVREHGRQEAKWREYEAAEPDLRIGGKLVAGEIAELTKRLNELKSEAHKIETTAAFKAAGAAQRVNELKSLHPHVLLPLDAAVDVRAKALKVDAPPPEPIVVGGV